MAHVATITIDYTKVPGDLTDYVGLIVPDGSAGYSALYALCLEGGGDIRLFKSDDTTELAREMVSFSASAETGEIHYKYSGTLSSSVDTDIHVYADGSSADYAVGATFGRNAVWSDYAAVYHMNQDPSGSSPQMVDSTGNGSGASIGSMTSGDLVDGQIGKNLDFDGASGSLGDSINIGKNSEINATIEKTVSAWIKADVWNNTAYPHIVAQRDPGGLIWAFNKTNLGATDVLSFSHVGSTRAFGAVSLPSSGTRHYVVGIISSGLVPKIYLNGSQPSYFTQTTGSSLSTATGIDTFIANKGGGDRAFDGEIDGVRIKATEDSANWITAEYNNQNSYNTFYSVAAVGGGSTPAQAARRGAVMMG